MKQFTSKYRGVSLGKSGRWVAVITNKGTGRVRHIGCFDTEEQAAIAYEIERGEHTTPQLRRDRSQCVCSVCGTTDKDLFYPYNRWICKKCHVTTCPKASSESRHRTYLKRLQSGKVSECNRRSWEKHGHKYADRNRRRRRQERVKLFLRLDHDSRRVIGIKASKLSTKEMEVLLNYRLFKLTQRGIVTIAEAAEFINRFNSDGVEALLQIYRFKLRGVNHGDLRR